MKSMLLPAAFALALAAGSTMTPPAQAKGCIKGAVVGGVAGHFAHHHTVLGAVGGCVVGHHLATKHARRGTGAATTTATAGGIERLRAHEFLQRPLTASPFTQLHYGDLIGKNGFWKRTGWY